MRAQEATVCGESWHSREGFMRASESLPYREDELLPHCYQEVRCEESQCFSKDGL